MSGDKRNAGFVAQGRGRDAVVVGLLHGVGGHSGCLFACSG